MEKSEQTMAEIVAIEWEMMDRVQNIGGRAPCQEDRGMFAAMRENQLAAWGPEMLESYLCDLEQAADEGRNLVEEKYAYMMERTSPDEYAALAEALPVPSVEKRWLADWICRGHMLWQEELAGEYPLLAGRGRNISRETDRKGATSFETYLRGELLTYSVETLRRYAAHVERMQKAGRNMNRVILEHTVARYGCTSLEEAERRLAGLGA